MKQLNVYVDETGEFGFFDGASDFYGLSFTFHDQKDNIEEDIKNLNKRLEKIGYTGMIHMTDLIMKRKEYSNFEISMRKSIFNAIYHFTRKAKIKYHTIIIDKKYTDNKKVLRRKIIYGCSSMIKKHENYFNSFDKIVIYYDNGQKPIGIILESIFSKFNNVEHVVLFDHKSSRLFQVSDMLTYIDKFDFKYKHNYNFSKSELYFFSLMEIRTLLKRLEGKRL